MRMIGAVLHLINRLRASQEWFSVGRTISDSEQLPEVVEVDSDLGMIGTIGCLIDQERTPQEWLGFGKAVGAV